MCYIWKLAGETGLLGSQKLSVFHNKTAIYLSITQKVGAVERMRVVPKKILEKIYFRTIYYAKRNSMVYGMV